VTENDEFRQTKYRSRKESLNLGKNKTAWSSIKRVECSLRAEKGEKMILTAIIKRSTSMRTHPLLLAATCVLTSIVCSVVMLYAADAASAILYVNGTTGFDSNTCGSISAPCKSINYTVNKRATADSIINATAGIYNESITVNLKSVSLSGAGSGSTSIIGNNSNATVAIFGPSRLVISGFTIKNGNPGIIGDASSVIAVKNIVLKGNKTGLDVRHNSFLSIQNCNVSNNSEDGISISQNSSASIDTCKILMNGGHGIRIEMSSIADVLNSRISNNSGSGLFVINSSSAKIGGSASSMSLVSGNQFFGIHVTGHSSVWLRGNNSVTQNSPSGITVQQSSQASIHNPGAGALDDVISNNYGAGISVGDASTLFMITGVVELNTSHGIQLIMNSTGHFEAGDTIRNNNGWGILCTDRQGDSKYGGAAEPNVSGNKLGKISCNHF
jgi:hypothetical protein